MSALLLVTPVAFAQMPASRGSVSRDLSLLPGPALLSPARGAPQRTESIAIIPASLVGVTPTMGSWSFVRATAGQKPEQTRSVKGSIAPTRAIPASKPSSDPSADLNARIMGETQFNTLRFDAKLAPVDTKLKKDTRSGR